ncbi:MAG: cell division topological specificity factor MinE [Clostridia bacterium]
MFEGIIKLFKKIGRKEREEISSKETAKERLHLVLMQDRANVSADFLEMMKQEIIEVIKKYIDVDEKDIDVRLTNKTNEDGTTGAPALYANIPIAGIKQDVVASEKKEEIKIDSETKVITEETKETVELENKKEDEDKQEGKEEISETNKGEAKEIVEETKDNKEPEKVEEEKKASNVAKKPSTAKKNTPKTSKNKTNKNGKKTTNTNKPKSQKSK